MEFDCIFDMLGLEDCFLTVFKVPFSDFGFLDGTWIRLHTSIKCMKFSNSYLKSLGIFTPLDTIIGVFIDYSKISVLELILIPDVRNLIVFKWM